MFWLALLRACLVYTIDRLSMAYSFKKPPMQNNSLNQTAIKLMSIGPWLYTIISIWIYSNQQVFENEIPTSSGDQIVPYSGHHISDLFTQVNPASPLLFSLGFMIITKIIYDTSLIKLGSKLYSKKVAIQEHKVSRPSNDRSFAESLKWKKSFQWVREAVVAHELLGIDSIEPHAFDQLIRASLTQQTAKDENVKAESYLQSLPNYDMLSNYEYGSKYLYVPCVFPTRGSVAVS